MAILIDDRTQKHIRLRLVRPGTTSLGPDDVATLTNLGWNSLLSELFPNGEFVGYADEHTGLASLISGPPSTLDSSDHTKSIATEDSRFGEEIVLAAGTPWELHFNAKTKALAAFLNDQAVYEGLLRDAFNTTEQPFDDNVSTAETLSDAHPPDAFSVDAIKGAFQSLVDHQASYFFKQSTEGKELQASAQSYWHSLLSEWTRKYPETQKTWPEIFRSIPTWLDRSVSIYESSKHMVRGPESFWPHVIVMVLMVRKHGRETLTQTDRMNLSELLEIGQKLNRLSMIGYNYHFDPIYDRRA